MRTLLEAANDEVALMALIQEAEGELTPELEAWLAEVEKNIATKADHYRFLLDRLSANAEVLKKRSQELAQAAKSLESVQESVKERIKKAMTAMGTTEIKGDAFRFKLSNSAPRVVVENEGAVPLTFQREVTVWEVDKKAIKESFDIGVPVDGCRLEQGQTLRVYINKEPSK